MIYDAFGYSGFANDITKKIDEAVLEGWRVKSVTLIGPQSRLYLVMEKFVDNSILRPTPLPL